MSGPLTVSSSRAVPAELERTFEVTMSQPLPRLFRRRFGPLPPIKEVRDQPATWDGVGQSRLIVLSGGGTMRETLTKVDRPRAFGYLIDEVTGPMKPIAAKVEGEWSFEPTGTGTRVTWTWTIHPPNQVGEFLLPVFGRFWKGYARQALEELEQVLAG
ncbi:MAG: SRPBCC family protein [Nocardioides sp.]